MREGAQKVWRGNAQEAEDRVGGFAETVEPNGGVGEEDGCEGGERGCGRRGEDRGRGGEGGFEQCAKACGMGRVNDAKIEEGYGIQHAC